MLFDNNRTTNTGGGFEPRSSAAQSMSSLHFSNSFSSGGTSRSLSQLAAANIQYSNDMTANVGPSNAGTPALLGNRPTFSGLSQQQQQPSSAQQQSNYADNGGIQESLDNHMDNILLRIVQMQQQQTKELLEERVQKRLKEDWDVSVQAWRNTLVGNRNFVDDTTEITMAAGGNKQHLMLTNGQSYGVGSQSLGLLNANGTETTQMVMDHLQIVQNMGQSTNVLQLMDNFETIATNDGYSSAWQLLKALLPNMSSPVGGALGALDFLCCQYQRVVEDRVRSASLNGHDVAAPVQYQNARANSAAAFVKLTIGSTASVWDIIYYCLRCGDAHAARAVVFNTQAGMANFAEEQPVLARILDQLASRQGSSSCMFGSGVAPLMDQPHQDAVRNFYEKTKELDADNKHKINVLALLSGNQMKTDQSNDLEDYLFARLWQAVQDKTDPAAKIIQIGTDIRRWGPSHFEADRRGAWAYCMPLMSSLQFQTALSFLSQHGGPVGLMQAAHLGLAFSTAGVSVTDLGHAQSSGSTYRDLSSILLVEYAKMLEREPPFGLISALQYLLKLPAKNDQMNEIAEMIFRNQTSMGAITGNYDKQMLVRKDCLLEQYLSLQDVSAVLELAGEKFQRDAANREKAQASATLFMLSGSYVKLLQLLHQLISPPNMFDDDKTFWANETHTFYNDYLNKHSIVKEALGREQKLSLVATTNILLGLRRFFLLYQKGHFRDAFHVLAALHLVPLSQDELEEKAGKFRDMDPLVKDAMAATLIAAVDCLYQDYRMKKSESRGLTDAMQVNLSEIKMKVRFLFLFSGSTSMPGECRQAINEMKGHMI